MMYIFYTKYVIIFSPLEKAYERTRDRTLIFFVKKSGASYEYYLNIIKNKFYSVYFLFYIPS